jgi:hypothetical protein
MECIAPDLAMHNTVLAMKDLAAFRRANGKIQEEEQRNLIAPREQCMHVPTGLLFHAAECIRAEFDQFAEVVWSWRFKDRNRKPIVSIVKLRKPDQFNRSYEVFVVWVALADDLLAELKFPFKAKGMFGHASNNLAGCCHSGQSTRLAAGSLPFSDRRSVFRG